MGVSTDAILAFGVDLGEDPDFLEIADRLLPPDHGWDKDLDPSEILSRAGFDGVEFIVHCSYNYPCYVMGIELARAWRGHARGIDVDRIGSADADVVRAAEALGVGPPRLLLFSLRG